MYCLSTARSRLCSACSDLNDWTLEEVYFFFFFQAEDGIRDRNVTGVQTCALPICANCAKDPDVERRQARLLHPARLPGGRKTHQNPSPCGSYGRFRPLSPPERLLHLSAQDRKSVV